MTRKAISATAQAHEITSECLGARLRMISRAVSRRYDEALRPLGVQFAQLNVLTLVTERGPVQQSEIARTLALEKSTLSRNVRTLQARGWITAEPAPTGNVTLLEATEAGRELVLDAAPYWRRVQDQIAEELGPAASKAVLRVARRINER